MRSHFSIHTWPESLSCSIDFYHCGNTAGERLRKAEEYLCNAFGWENCTGSVLIERGGSRQALLNEKESNATIYKETKLVYREKSNLQQDIRVYESKEMGKLLTVNGNIHIALNIKDNFSNDIMKLLTEKGKTHDNLLIIGAGDLRLPAFLLTNSNSNVIKKITLVFNDMRVFETSKKFFPFEGNISNHIKEGKLEIFVEDTIKFLSSKSSESYSGIVLEYSETKMDGPLNDNYHFIHSILKKDGRFVQRISEESFKNNWENLVRTAGFDNIAIHSSQTPEFSYACPLGFGRKTGV